MPCILKIRVISARDLPVMDRSSELADAFAEVRFGDFDPLRTAIARKTLNPLWNEDFRFEVSDDAVLQNEPVEIRVLDYDTITANDPVGAVLLDLDPLLQFESVGQISGWFPLYDSLRGVRGQINVQVKLQFFGDVNPFKESSAGVQFFAATAVPACFRVLTMSGLVEGIVSEDDPEFHWSDSFRTPRSSNDARQRLLFRLNGQLRRVLGKKVLDLGGNAVIGFKQYYDLENEERLITARAYGTACRIARVDPTVSEQNPSSLPLFGRSSALFHTSQQQPSQTNVQPIEVSTILDANMLMNDQHLPNVAIPSRRNSISVASNFLADAVASNSTNILESPPGYARAQSRRRKQQYLEQPVQLITLQSFPPWSILGIGGLVTAKSVKLLGVENSKVREQWWSELREEIKSHARTLNCPFVVGYTETVSIQDELCVLNALGTAIVLDPSHFHVPPIRDHLNDIHRNMRSSSGSIVNTSTTPAATTTSPVHTNMDKVNDTERESPQPTGSRKMSRNSSYVEQSPLEQIYRQRFPTSRKRHIACRMCHVPYSRTTTPFPMSFVKCGICKRKHVPEILLSTIEPPAEAQVIGQGSYIEAHVCRSKRNKDGETNASNVSDAIPFTEYDLHRQLAYKLRVHGMNAIFGLKVQLAVGEELIVAVASGTALFLQALPVPTSLKIARNLNSVSNDDTQSVEIQRRIVELSEANSRAVQESRRVLENDDFFVNNNTNQLSGEAMTRSEVVSVTSSDSDSDTDTDSDLDSDAGDDRHYNSNHNHDREYGLGPSYGYANENEQPYSRSNMVIQIDDDADEDLMAVLLDPKLPEGFYLCSTESLPMRTRYPVQLQQHGAFELQMIIAIKQTTLHPKTHRANRELAAIFRELYDELRFRLSYLFPCVIAGIAVDVQIQEENQCQLRFTAMAMGNKLAQDEELFGNNSMLATAMSVRALSRLPSHRQHPLHPLDRQQSATIATVTESVTSENIPPRSSTIVDSSKNSSSNSLDNSKLSRLTSDLVKSMELVIDQQMVFEMEEETIHSGPTTTTTSVLQPPIPLRSTTTTLPERQTNNHIEPALRSSIAPISSGLMIDTTLSTKPVQAQLIQPQSTMYSTPIQQSFHMPPIHVEMSPLSFIPGTVIDAYMGKLSLHFVKEASVIHETVTAGMGGFLHTFMSEVFAIVRAHVLALGGNAFVAMHIEQSGFSENVKNQAYALVSISGDVCRLVGGGSGWNGGNIPTTGG